MAKRTVKQNKKPYIKAKPKPKVRGRVVPVSPADSIDNYLILEVTGGSTYAYVQNLAQLRLLRKTHGSNFITEPRKQLGLDCSLMNYPDGTFFALRLANGRDEPYVSYGRLDTALKAVGYEVDAGSSDFVVYAEPNDPTNAGVIVLPRRLPAAPVANHHLQIVETTLRSAGRVNMAKFTAAITVPDA
jgi:hypothetical protein